MNDLLGSVGNHAPAERKISGDIELGDVHIRTDATTDIQQAMQRFFKSVEEIKLDLAEIKGLQLEVVEMNEHGKALIKTKEVKQHQEDMQAKVNQVNTVAHRVKRKIEALDKENEAATQLPGAGIGSANERTRTTITAGLKKKLRDLMGEFSNLRNQIQEEYRALVGRRLQTITGTAVSDEEVDRVIETGEAENLFQKAFNEQGRGQVMDVLAEIQERNRAVKDLEKSLLELHQIFLDMAVLVEAQGQTLDSIQKQVERSANYVETGTNAVVDAKNIQKNTRKWMLCGIIAAIIAIIIIVLAIQPWQYARNATG